MNATKVGILSTVLFGLIATTSAHAASLKLKINPKSLPFGKVEVDMVSAPKTLTLSNLSGASEIAIASIQIASGPFVIGTDNCSGATLAPKGSASSSCTISVTFNPASASNPKGTKESGALTITDSATSDDATSSKSPQPVKLTGTAFGIPTAGPAEWSMFQHDLSHTGLSQFSTAADTGTLKWSFATGETIFNSAPVIGQDGTIYIEAQGKLDSGRLVAVNSNGTKRWSLIGAGAILSTPAIGADGAIYSKDAKSHQLDAVNSDGTKEWSFTAAGVVTSSAAIGADGTIYFGDTDFDRSGDQVASELYAVNPNGSQKWSFHTGFGVSSSPAIGADGTIYFGSNDSNLYAVNPDGTEKWSFLTGNQVESSPAIGPDGTIYFGSYDGNLYAVNPEGTEKWSFPTGLAGGENDSTPAIGADGTIYMIDGAVYAVNPDGSQKWIFQPADTFFSSPAIGADGTVYLGSGRGNLYAVNPDGSQKWELLVSSAVDRILSSPAIGADGTIYVGSEDGNLYAVH